MVIWHTREDCIGAEGRNLKTLRIPESLVAASLLLCQPKLLACWNRVVSLICIDGAAVIRL